MSNPLYHGSASPGVIPSSCFTVQPGQIVKVMACGMDAGDVAALTVPCFSPFCSSGSEEQVPYKGLELAGEGFQELVLTSPGTYCIDTSAVAGENASIWYECCGEGEFTIPVGAGAGGGEPPVIELGDVVVNVDFAPLTTALEACCAQLVASSDAQTAALVDIATAAALSAEKMCDIADALGCGEDEPECVPVCWSVEVPFDTSTAPVRGGGMLAYSMGGAPFATSQWVGSGNGQTVNPAPNGVIAPYDTWPSLNLPSLAGGTNTDTASLKFEEKVCGKFSMYLMDIDITPGGGSTNFANWSSPPVEILATDNNLDFTTVGAFTDVTSQGVDTSQADQSQYTNGNTTSGVSYRLTFDVECVDEITYDVNVVNWGGGGERHQFVFLTTPEMKFGCVQDGQYFDEDMNPIEAPENVLSPDSPCCVGCE